MPWRSPRNGSAYAPKPQPLAGDDRWHVFLSYRSVNRAWVLNLYDVLRELGHEVFLDQVALKAGDALTVTLQKALGASQSRRSDLVDPHSRFRMGAA